MADGDELKRQLLRFLVTHMEEVQNPTSIELAGLSHTKTSGLYWSLCAMYILHNRQPTNVLLQSIAPDTSITTESLLQFIKDCLVINEKEEAAGFSGSPGHDAHLIHTTSALQCLLLLNSFSEVVTPNLGVVLANSIARLQADDGGFYGDYTKEKDTRFAYCAVLSLIILLKRVPSLIGISIAQLINVDTLCSYLLRCYNADGGFGTAPGDESHGGQIFCCVATLHLLDSLHLILNLHRSLFFLANRQCSNGGFCGRPEKDPDSCYSWWIGSSMYILLDYLYNGNNSHTIDRTDEHVQRIKSGTLFSIDSLVCYINACVHPTLRGIADRPENHPDEYHTFFSLAALSLWDTTLPNLSKLCPLHPSLALPMPICHQLFSGERRFSTDTTRSSSAGTCARITPHLRHNKGSSCTPTPREISLGFFNAYTFLKPSSVHNVSAGLVDCKTSPFQVHQKYKTVEQAKISTSMDQSGNISQESIGMQPAQLPPIDIQARRDASSILFEGRGVGAHVNMSLNAKLYELRKISALLALEDKTVTSISEYLSANHKGPIPSDLLPGNSCINASSGDIERQPSVMLLSSVINKAPNIVYLSHKQAQLSDDAEVRVDKGEKGDEKSFSTGMPTLLTDESRAMNILLMSMSKGKQAPSTYEDNDGCVNLNPAALDHLDTLLDLTSDGVDNADASPCPTAGFSNAHGFARISSLLTVKAQNLSGATNGNGNQILDHVAPQSFNTKGDKQDKVTFASPLHDIQRRRGVQEAAMSRTNLLDNNAFEKLFTSTFAMDQQQSGLTDSQIINTFIDTDLSHQPSIYRYQSIARNFFDSLSIQDQSDLTSALKVPGKQDFPGDVLLNWMPNGMVGRSGIDSFREKEPLSTRSHKPNMRANATASVLFTEPQIGVGLRRNRQQQSSFLYQANQASGDMLSARLQRSRTDSNARESNQHPLGTGMLSTVVQQMIARLLGDRGQIQDDQKDVISATDGGKTGQKFNAAGGLNVGALINTAFLDISRIHALVQTPSKKGKASLDADALQETSVGMLNKEPECADNEVDVDSEVKEPGPSNMSDIALNVDVETPASPLFNSKSQSSVERCVHTQDTVTYDDNNEPVISEII